MNHTPALPRRQVSREVPYSLVWKTPMSRLSADFGLSGNGLANICALYARPGRRGAAYE